MAAEILTMLILALLTVPSVLVMMEVLRSDDRAADTTQEQVAHPLSKTVQNQ